MRRFFASVLVTLIVVIVLLAVVLAVALGFVGVGWVVDRAFGMGLLPSTAIAVVVGVGVAYFVFRAFSMSDLRPEEDLEDWDEDWEEWEEEEEEENEPPIVPWRRHRPTPADPEEVERSRRKDKKK